MKKSNNPTPVPRHVAIICDGNRRWAKQQGLSAVMGHREAAQKTFEPLVDTALAAGVSYLTFWVFSTENWQRSSAEVAALMEIFRQQLDRYADSLDGKKIRFRTIGDLTKFPADIQEKIARTVQKTAHNTDLTVVFALNYGGRDELVRAMKRIAQQILDGTVSPEDITTDHLSMALDTAGLPDPDLIIRTGGEQRLSGFLPWQGVYSELAFIPEYFPDFSAAVFKAQLTAFATRERRFGR